MGNGEVVWAWVAGLLVTLVLLVALSRLDGRGAGSRGYDETFTLHEATLGAAQWDVKAWERTGGTPPRAPPEEPLNDALDLMDRLLPGGNAAASGVMTDDAPPAR